MHVLLDDTEPGVPQDGGERGEVYFRIHSHARSKGVTQIVDDEPVD